MSPEAAGPVWAVYDLYRRSRIEVKYYAARIEHLRTQSLAMDAVLAVSIPAAIVAAVWPGNHALTDALWKFFAAAAVLVALAKPLLGSFLNIRKRERALEEYGALARELHSLTVQIRAEKAYGPQARATFAEIGRRYGALLRRRVEHIEDRRLRQHCAAQADRELPREVFYVPPADEPAAHGP